MPTYKFKNKDTGKTETVFMKISERDAYLEANPNIEQLVHGFPGTVDPTRLGRVKPDNGFKDMLKHIKKGNPGSTINTW